MLEGRTKRRSLKQEKGLGLDWSLVEPQYYFLVEKQREEYIFATHMFDGNGYRVTVVRLKPGNCGRRQT